MQFQDCKLQQELICLDSYIASFLYLPLMLLQFLPDTYPSLTFLWEADHCASICEVLPMKISIASWQQEHYISLGDRHFQESFLSEIHHLLLALQKGGHYLPFLLSKLFKGRNTVFSVEMVTHREVKSQFQNRHVQQLYPGFSKQKKKSLKGEKYT